MTNDLLHHLAFLNILHWSTIRSMLGKRLWRWSSVDMMIGRHLNWAAAVVRMRTGGLGYPLCYFRVSPAPVLYPWIHNSGIAPETPRLLFVNVNCHTLLPPAECTPHTHLSRLQKKQIHRQIIVIWRLNVWIKSGNPLCFLDAQQCHASTN